MSQSRTDGQTDLVVQDKRSASLAQVQDVVPQDPIMALMSKFASNDSISPEKAKMLLDIYVDGQRRMQEMQDERAFADAMADFKKNPPKIIKNRVARAEKDGRLLYTYNFADLDAYATAIMAGLAERGITWSFPFTEANEKITVSCILRYGLYTHEPTTMTAGPDNTGGKNAIQAKASTISYLERYTLCGASGFTAAMPDSDGKPPKSDAPQKETIPDDKVDEWIEALQQAPDIDALKAVFSQCYGLAKKISDESAKKQFLATYESAKKQFGGSR